MYSLNKNFNGPNHIYHGNFGTVPTNRRNSTTKYSGSFVLLDPPPSSSSSSSCGKCAGEQLIVADIVLACSPPPLVYNQPSPFLHFFSFIRGPSSAFLVFVKSFRFLPQFSLDGFVESSESTCEVTFVNVMHCMLGK